MSNLVLFSRIIRNMANYYSLRLQNYIFLSLHLYTSVMFYRKAFQMPIFKLQYYLINHVIRKARRRYLQSPAHTSSLPVLRHRLAADHATDTIVFFQTITYICR